MSIVPRRTLARKEAIICIEKFFFSFETPVFP
jgi:hypothetical protein